MEELGVKVEEDNSKVSDLDHEKMELTFAKMSPLGRSRLGLGVCEVLRCLQVRSSCHKSSDFMYFISTAQVGKWRHWNLRVPRF